MNVEDSYEGAVRRLQRLEMAGIAIESPPSQEVDRAAVEGDGERMRELEELATLACADNDRLKSEFGTALQELDDARRELDGVRAEREQLHRAAHEARFEIDQLRAYVASLEQALASAEKAPTSAAPRSAVMTAVPAPFEASPFATDALNAIPEDDFGYPPKKSKGALYFFVVAIAGAGIAALFMIRPWDRPHAPPVIVEQPAPPPPVVTAPPPAPRVTPPLPAVAPTVPKIEATIPQKARATKTRSERKHSKHRSAKKETAATAKTPASDSNDPLGGTGL